MMAASEEKQNCSPKTAHDYIKELNIKSIEEFHKKYEDVDKKDLLAHNFLDGEGHAVYRVSVKNKSNQNIIVRKHSMSSPDDYYKDVYDKLWPKLAKLYTLMKKTKLLNYYDLYFTTENDIDYLLITMEELQMTLTDYVKSKYENKGPGISENECKSMIRNLIHQLSILHHEGYAHTDIKPDNIMLRDKKINPEQNSWRLIDYDSMIFIGDDDYYQTKYAQGTAWWTSPEINPFIRDDEDPENYNKLTYGVDMWGLGMIILYILEGENVYQLTKWEKWRCSYIPWSKSHYAIYYNTKLLGGGKYDKDSDKNKGEIWLRNHLISLYYNNKISKNLFDLLHDYLLVFDPRKRGKSADVLNHAWFKSN